MSAAHAYAEPRPELTAEAGAAISAWADIDIDPDMGYPASRDLCDPLSDANGPIFAFDQFPAAPAEACTELGAHTEPLPLGLWRRLRVALLRFHMACLVDEREHYRALGWIGPVYLRESYAQQRQLMSRIAALQNPPVQPTASRTSPARGWRLTAATCCVAVLAGACLVLAACGGGGSSDEPAPRPPVDCGMTPEQCK